MVSTAIGAATAILTPLMPRQVQEYPLGYRRNGMIYVKWVGDKPCAGDTLVHTVDIRMD